MSDISINYEIVASRLAGIISELTYKATQLEVIAETLQARITELEQAAEDSKADADSPDER